MSDVHTNFVIDTGSAVNIISSSFVSKLGSAVKVSPSNVFIKGISGSLVSPVGQAELYIRFGVTTLKDTFLVVEDSPYDVLGGLPFCKKSQLLIDFADKKLTILNETYAIEFEENVSHHKENIPTHSLEQVRVEPRSEIVLPVKVRRDGVHVIEQNLNIKNGLRVARTATNVENGVGFVRAANLTAAVIIVHKNTKIGWATSVHDSKYGISVPFQESKKSDVNFELGSHLSECQRKKILAVIGRFRHLFTGEDNPIQRTHVAEHTIDTGDSRPIRQHPYRHSPFERQVIQEQVEGMLREGVIRESHSPWSSPVVLVKKPNGGWRFCVDFRRLNAVSRKDVHPLPRIDDILDVLQGVRFFTTLDLTSGYWQVGIKEEDKPKTAFACGPGLYEFNVIPFGLCNAPATFQRMINKVLSGLLWKVCLAYLDDIVIFSKTLSTHLYDLEQVFEALDCAKLRLNTEKCAFAKNEIKYLGHVLTGEEIRPDPEKVSAIENFPTPKTKKQVQSFLGICNYYRRFIKNFSTIACPLTDLTRKHASFIWDPRCDHAMTALKHKLISEPVLAQFDPKRPIEIHTDACDYGIEAVLVQRHESEERVVAYASRHLNKAEINNSTTEKECLAIVYACRQFRPYIFGSPFTVITDQASLSWLMNVRNQNGRLIRWSLLLQEFQITLKHRPGRKNGNTDTLSRLPNDPAPVSEENFLPLLVLDQVDVGEKQRGDAFLGTILRHLQSPDAPVARKLRKTARAFRIVGGVLYRRAKGFEEDKLVLALPRCLRSEVLRHCHDDTTAGHLGIKRT